MNVITFEYVDDYVTKYYDEGVKINLVTKKNIKYVVPPV